MPIAQHQAVQFMIAEMVMAYEATRMLYLKAAWEVDNGVKRTSTSAIAKALGADWAMKAATDAVQVFGGYGYTKEYPGREADARREAAADLRGHLADPAGGDRAQLPDADLSRRDT